jgi:hypothetical protein
VSGGSFERGFHECDVACSCPKQPFGLLKAASGGLDNGNSVPWGRRGGSGE